MKKLLFILLLITTIAYSQRHGTATEQIEAAQKYLKNNPCSYTGISWLESALKQEPNNNKAIYLLKKCDDYKLSQAKILFKKAKNDLKNNQVGVIDELRKVVGIDSLNAEALYLYGKLKSQNKSFDIGIKYLSKAIKLNPTNPNYYWFRSSAFLNKYFNDHNLELGVNLGVADLDKMISLNAKSSKIYSAKAFMYENLAKEYGQKYEYFKPKISDGWQDDGSQKKDKIALFNEAVKNYKLAEDNYKKALDIDPKNAGVKSSLKYLLVHLKNLKEL